MKIYKPIGILVVVFVALATLNAMQFAATAYTIDATVSTYNAYVKYLAKDNRSETAGAPVLYRSDNTTGTYRLTLGKWHPEASKLWSASFALVNEEKNRVRIQSMAISGTGSSYVTVSVHGDPTKTANNTVGTQMGNYDNTNATYIASGVTQDVTNKWVMAAGDGTMSTYMPNAAQKTCTWDTTYYVWKADPTDTTAAVNNTGDMTYIEIDLYFPASAHSGAGETGVSFSVALSIYLEGID